MDTVLQLLDGPLMVLNDSLQGDDEVVAVAQLGGVGLLQDVHLLPLAALLILQTFFVLLVVFCQVLRKQKKKHSIMISLLLFVLSGPVHAKAEI